MPMALAVGGAARCSRLEPNPYVFKVLALNATLNPRTTRIVPLMFAAMPEDGEFEFEYLRRGVLQRRISPVDQPLEARPLFEVARPGQKPCGLPAANAADELSRLRLIKIDTEGFDRRNRAIARRSGEDPPAVHQVGNLQAPAGG